MKRHKVKGRLPNFRKVWSLYIWCECDAPTLVDVATCDTCGFTLCLACGEDAGISYSILDCTRGCEKRKWYPPAMRPRTKGPWARRR